MMLNREAPISERYEIDIFAPPQKVWEWLSRVELWQSWRQDVSSAYWDKGHGEGGTLKWRIRNLIRFKATVERWRDSREIHLNSSALLTRISYSMLITGDIKRSKVTLKVSASGGLARFAPTRAILRGQLNRSNEIMLGALKTKLEAGKDDSVDPPAGLQEPFANNVKLPSQQPGIGN